MRAFVQRVGAIAEVRAREVLRQLTGYLQAFYRQLIHRWRVNAVQVGIIEAVDPSGGIVKAADCAEAVLNNGEIHAVHYTVPTTKLTQVVVLPPTLNVSMLRGSLSW